MLKENRAGGPKAEIMRQDDFSGLAKIKLFLALSRTRHGLLDICTPLLAALLWLGHIPDPRTTVLGILAAVGGYTSVYALNDIVDYRSDKEKLGRTAEGQKGAYLDGTSIRHPLARGYLSMKEAVAWAGGWGVLSLAAAFLLNPVCALILVVGCILETVYCLLLRVSPYRVLVSGIVKTLGGLAAVFAVDPSPAPVLLLLIFFWLFFWEIGGQNIPADWHDIEEDTLLKARTVPVAFGPDKASAIALGTLSASLLLSGILFQAVPLPFPSYLYLAVLAVGIYFFLIPALRLRQERDRVAAASLFNRASWYPCALLVVTFFALGV